MVEESFYSLEVVAISFCTIHSLNFLISQTTESNESDMFSGGITIT